MIFQRTLRRPVLVQGIGLHSGKPVKLSIQPASPNTGIVFVRTDLLNSPLIPAHFKYVVNTQLATTLGRDKVTVSTVEHLLAALQGMGVDNARVEVNGPEIPIMDGSSLPFMKAFEEAGLESQLQQRAVLALRKRVELKVSEKWAYAEPAARFEVHGTIEWDHPAIGYQEFHYVEGKTPFSQLADARTFCMLRDVEAMQRVGLARGGSLDNAVVLDDARVVNPHGLRSPDEFVRHKVLDALGDFKLAGIAIQGYIRLHRAGHELHSLLLTEIFKDPDNFEIIDSSVREEQKPARIRAVAAMAGWAASY